MSIYYRDRTAEIILLTIYNPVASAVMAGEGCLSYYRFKWHVKAAAIHGKITSYEAAIILENIDYWEAYVIENYMILKSG